MDRPRVIDTNVLIRLWRGLAPSRGRVVSKESAEDAARAWLSYYKLDVIVTPVRLEFLGGTRDRDELKLADHFLSLFPLLDGGRVLPEDWAVAERYARHAPHDGRPRGAIDCLITAIADRLHADIRSDDEGLPRRKKKS